MLNIEIILNYIKQNKLTKRKFAQMCHISENTLYNILKNNCKTTLYTIFCIAKTMNVEIRYLIKK